MLSLITNLLYSTYLWTRQHAITYTKLYVLGWDGYSPGINYTTDHIKIQRCFGVHHKVSYSESTLLLRYCDLELFKGMKTPLFIYFIGSP